MHFSNIVIIFYGNYNIKSKVRCFDRGIVRLHTTISYNILYYMYDKLRFGRAIVCLHATEILQGRGSVYTSSDPFDDQLVAFKLPASRTYSIIVKLSR